MSVTPTIFSSPSHAGNAGVARLRFIAALLNAKPDQVMEAAPAGSQAVAHRPPKSLWALYRMANRYDSVMPDLGLELRFIAARD